MKTLEEKFWLKVDIRGQNECWLWKASSTNNGYGQFYFGSHKYAAHRTAYELSNGAVRKGLHVLHRCDTPRCCNPQHLRVGTHAENMRERDERGRRSGGKPRVLTPEDVRAIRADKGTPGANEAHARRLGVNSGTVWAAANGLTYREVQP